MEVDLTAPEYAALAEFRYQIRRFLRRSEEAAADAGVEPRQYQFLLALRAQQGQVTIRELAERMQLRHHSVVGLINRLVERKLIERRRGEQDRRQVYIHLTSKGEAMLRRLALFHRGELQAAGPALVKALNALMAGRAVQPIGEATKA